MRGLLAAWFVFVLLAMVAVTTWAGLRENVLAAFVRLAQDPWSLATLLDAYFGFLAFWIWLAWKEGSYPLSILWLVAILLLGNLAMAAYALIQLWQSPDLETFFTRRQACSSKR